MKKNMRKIMGIMLAMILAIAMCLPVLATEPESGTEPETKILTIETAEGHTYEVYQMLKGDVSSLSNGAGTLANVTAGDNLSGSVDDFDDAIKDDDGNYLQDTALASEASKKIDSTKAPYATIIGDGEAKSADVAPGYYVVKDKYTDNGTPCTAYMVAVVGNTTMKPKVSIPDLDKNITDDDSNKALETLGAEDEALITNRKTDTAAIGDVIHYELKSHVPVTDGYKYYYYVINDTLSKGLTLCEAKDFKVMIDGAEIDPGAANNQYTLTIDKEKNTFELVINDMKAFKAKAGKEIIITYSATVNEDAEVGLNPNTNTSTLTYSNNPEDTFDKDKEDDNKPGEGDATGITPEKTTKTYVTELTIQKTDIKGKFIQALRTAEFTLTGNGLNDVVLTTESKFEKAAEGGEYYLLKDGTYTKAAPISEGDDKNIDKYEETTPNYKLVTLVSCTNAESGADASITAAVDDNGQITFKGLNAGTYTLSETKVPEGYNKANDIVFTISAKQKAGEVTGDAGTAIEWKSDNDKVHLDGATGVFDATIENSEGSTLPTTGGIGTTIFYVLGTILAIGAGIVLVARRRAR